MIKVDSLEGQFIYFTECNLATLELLRSRKGSSKSDIRRQLSICDNMMRVIRETHPTWSPLDFAGNPRVLKSLRDGFTS